MSTITCPVCQGAFKEIIREGILIDVCTQCKGVWLDRGELEKLLASVRSESDGVASPTPSVEKQQPVTDYRDPYRGKPSYDDDDALYREKHYGEKYPRPYRKKSKLERLFDIFD